MILLSQDVRIGHSFDASIVIDDLVTVGHLSGHDPNCLEMYHMAQFELFDICEIESEGNTITFHSPHFPSITVPINFLMGVENVH